MEDVKIYKVTLDDFSKAIVLDALKESAFRCRKEGNKNAWFNYMNVHDDLCEELSYQH